MNAKKAVKRFGNALLGCTVRTEAIGTWPGGLAKVTELQPDPGAKDIVMMVKGTHGQGEMGILDRENIEIV